MGFFSDHQHSIVTETIERLVSSNDITLEVELAKLIQYIHSNSEFEFQNNQIEAARAIRKQLKYGNTLNQSRSLDLLNLFISQLIKFSFIYNDTKLLERLKCIALNSERRYQGKPYDARIIKKCANYIITWNNFLNEQASNSKIFAKINNLGEMVKLNYKKSSGNNRKESKKNNNFLKDTADHSIFVSNSADELYGIPKINMEKESSKIKLLISDSLASAISLQNSLMELNPNKSSLDDEDCTAKFIQARAIRRKVLRYLQLVTEGEFLGSLIRANEELVNALTKYDEASNMSRDNNNDNDDDYTDLEYNEEFSSNQRESLELYDENNPFSDQNQI